MKDLNFEAFYHLMLMERMCRIGLPSKEVLYKVPKIHVRKSE